MSGCGSKLPDQEGGAQQKFKGVRRRKWGKWVSEIRVPGKQERLWLGSYSTPQAAAVAHDIASYCFRGPASIESLNLPLMLPASVSDNMSPRSIQKAASDAGMAIDAQMVLARMRGNEISVTTETDSIQGLETDHSSKNCGGWGHVCEGSCNHGRRREDQADLNISVEDYLQ